MSKKSNLYLKILVLLTLIMGFNCQDCFNHSAFKIHCHKDEKVAKSFSFMHEQEVYCQCNGPRFGCEPNKACGVNAYIYSSSSEIILKLTMIDENGEAYKIALPGSLMLDLWWRYKFFVMDEEPLNAEPSNYAYCYVMMDELKARFKALRNKEITNTTPPEEFELSCNSQDIVKIMLYKSNINKYVKIVHKDHIIEAWEDGNITQKIEELEKIVDVSIQHFPRITYYISNNLEPKHIILNSLSNVNSSEKPKVLCTAASCDVPMKVEELEEADATNKKGIDNNRDAIVQLKNEDRKLKADVKQVNSKLDEETRAWNNTVQMLNENITAIDHKNHKLSDQVKVNEGEDRRMNKTIHDLEARLSKLESRESSLSFLIWILVGIIIFLFIILIAGLILWFVKYRSNSNNQNSNPETRHLVNEV